MRVKDILKAKGNHVFYVRENDLLGEAISLMRREHVGAVAVLDAQDCLQGMLSEREVVRALAREPDRAMQRRCAVVMLRELSVCEPETTVHDLAQLMTHRRTRHVAVLEAEKLLGVVSVGDVTKAQLEEKRRENDVLQDMLRTYKVAFA